MVSTGIESSSSIQITEHSYEEENKNKTEMQHSVEQEVSQSSSPSSSSPTTSMQSATQSVNTLSLLNSSTSMITINSDDNLIPPMPDETMEPRNLILPNSIESGSGQVTVVTSTHPPIIVDNTEHFQSDHKNNTNDVIIVSNNMDNSTHVQESSVDEDYPSMEDSFGVFGVPSPALHKQSSMIVTLGNEEIDDRGYASHQPTIGTHARKLDESEVLIISPSFTQEDDSAYSTPSEIHNDQSSNQELMDTSHVSVITVGDEIKVRDSSNLPQSPNVVEVKKPSQQNNHNGKSINAIGQQNMPLGNVEDINIIVNQYNKTSDVSDSNSTPLSSESGNRIMNRGIGVKMSATGDRSDVDSICTITSNDSRMGIEIENEAVISKSDDTEDGEVVIRRRPSSVNKGDFRSVPNLTKEEIELRNLRKKTRKRTRKFEIDGVQVTTTTSRVIYGDEETGRLYDDHVFRKQELRELKMLQKQEKKQQTDLHIKEQVSKEQQDRKFEQERVSLEKTYEADMDTLARQHKQLIEKTEQMQEHELRSSSKRIRGEQEKELKIFRDNLKQEIHLLKQEVDLLPKDKRKDEFKRRKSAMELDHEDKERSFLNSLKERHELLLRRLSEKHRDHLATIHKNFLQQKQNAMRTREALLWELEEKQLHEKHQLSKRHIKETCFMQRHQMIIRHEKELEQAKRMLQRKEEDLLKKQALEKRALPKRIRAERKARELMFRESLRISSNLDPEVERERLKKVFYNFSILIFILTF